MLLIYNHITYKSHVDLGTHSLTQLQMENPEPFLHDLHGKVISVMLKWGW